LGAASVEITVLFHEFETDQLVQSSRRASTTSGPMIKARREGLDTDPFKFGGTERYFYDAAPKIEGTPTPSPSPISFA